MVMASSALLNGSIKMHAECHLEMGGDLPVVIS